MSNITIIGGHGKVSIIVHRFSLEAPLNLYLTDFGLGPQVALRLAKILSAQKHSVISVIRDKAQASDISATGAKPEVLSLEDAPASTFAELFQRTNTSLVYFSAGAGGKGGEARTKAVDYDGALKIFDAIELVPQGSRPFLVLVSGIDVRHPDKIPAHYVSADLPGHFIASLCSSLTMLNDVTTSRIFASVDFSATNSKQSTYGFNRLSSQSFLLGPVERRRQSHLQSHARSDPNLGEVEIRSRQRINHAHWLQVVRAASRGSSRRTRYW